MNTMTQSATISSVKHLTAKEPHTRTHHSVRCVLRGSSSRNEGIRITASSTSVKKGFQNRSARRTLVSNSSVMESAARQIPIRNRFHAKDPISALTHFVGFLMAIIATPILLIHASGLGDSLTSMVSFGVFMMSMILLYGASASYHTFELSDTANKRLKRLDHMSIFVLIAGSYTPVCLIALPTSPGMHLLIAVWAVAAVGLLFKFFWVTCPKWVSSVIYIGMGWLCISVLPTLIRELPAGGFAWLLAGGLLYTIGGVIYALKLSIIPKSIKGFGNHDLFHLFVMGGSFCHYMFAYTSLCLLG